MLSPRDLIHEVYVGMQPPGATPALQSLLYAILAGVSWSLGVPVGMARHAWAVFYALIGIRLKLGRSLVQRFRQGRATMNR